VLGQRLLSLGSRRVTALALIAFTAAGCSAGTPAAEAPPQVARAGDAGGFPGAVPGAPQAAPAQPGQEPAPYDVPKQQQASPGNPGNAAPAGAKTSTTSSKDEQRTVSQALIMYTGDVALTVDADAVARTIDSVVDAAESVGGHLAGRTNDTVKVKVPSQRFREGVQKIEKLGAVTSSNVTAEDVTAEFKDAEVRLENLKATRKRLEEFLARAGTMADMLTVERELERVAKEMDVLSGRLRFLKEHTAFSLLTVRLTAKAKPTPVVVVDAPPPPPPAPPPPARSADLPVSWFDTLGVAELLKLPAAKK
jgi:hypothetical protein